MRRLRVGHQSEGEAGRMEVTAQMVKDLRSRTGAGIMDCKEALREKEGDIEEAVRYLREKGLSSAAKKAGREASDGLVENQISSNGRVGVLVEVNCETDFVAKTDDFKELVGKVTQHVMDKGPESIPPNPGGEPIQELVTAAIAKLGENMLVPRAERFEIPEGQAGKVVSYIHPGGAIGVLVDLRSGKENTASGAEFAELAKDLAMHIAASNPLYLQSDQVPGSVMESERAILIAQSKDSGKPENIIEKMVEGRLNKYLKEICLMDQPFVKDPDRTVKVLLADKSKEVGDKLEIARFVRFQRGEQAGQGE